jgi:hypothetical protein
MSFFSSKRDGSWLTAHGGGGGGIRWHRDELVGVGGNGALRRAGEDWVGETGAELNGSEV